MANTKDITIEGFMPYDCGSHRQTEARERVLNCIGAMHLPASGLTFEWDESFTVPNPISKRGGPSNGIDTYYFFSVTGVESFSGKFWDMFIESTVAIGGLITMTDVVDLTNNYARYDLNPTLTPEQHTRHENILKYLSLRGDIVLAGEGELATTPV